MFLNISVSGTITVNHHILLPQPTGDEITAVVTPLLATLKDQIMSAVSDAIATLNTSIDGVTARVTTDVAALKATIADLQAKVDAGLATPEDIAALAAAATRLDQVDPATSTVLPTP